MLEKNVERMATALERIATVLEGNQPVSAPIAAPAPLQPQEIFVPDNALKEEVVSDKQMANMLKPGALTPPPVPTMVKEAPKSELDRNQIKAELDSLGVEYKTRSNTGTLAKLLAKAKGQNAPTASAPTTMPTAPITPVSAPSLMPTAPITPVSAPSLMPTAPAASQEPNLLAEQPTTEAPAETEKVVTIEEARETLKNFAAEYGADKAKAVLKEFNATKLSEIQPNFLNQFILQIGTAIKNMTGMFN